MVLVFTMFSLPRIIMEMYRLGLWSHDKAVDELIALSTPRRRFTKNSAASYLTGERHARILEAKRRKQGELERYRERMERRRRGEHVSSIQVLEQLQADVGVQEGSRPLDEDLPY